MQEPTGWLVLIVRLPPQPSSLRVRAWRKLRAIGAVPLKNSVYLLPFTPDNDEHFQWLAQEVEKDRGEATLLRVDRIENLAPAEVVRLFQEARDRDYRDLARRFRKVAQGLDRATPPAAGRREAELARLARELAQVREIDFFDAPGYREVERLRETLAARLRRREPARAVAAPVDLATLRGRRWVTRPRPHVDRIASAWLIKRFVDGDAEILFASPEEFPADAVPFDAAGAEFGHQGEDCTFETLLRRTGLRDRRLAQLAELVHEADLRDGKFPREEARGVDLAIRGLLAVVKDDREVLQQGLTLFDGLYAVLGRRG
jgi:hypothetical protein